MREPSKPQFGSLPQPQAKVEPVPNLAPIRPAFDPPGPPPPASGSAGEFIAPPAAPADAAECVTPAEPGALSSLSPLAEAVCPASLLTPPPSPPLLPRAFESSPPLATPLPDPVPSAPLSHKPSPPPPFVEITAPSSTPTDPATPRAEPAAAASSPSLLPPLNPPPTGELQLNYDTNAHTHTCFLMSSSVFRSSYICAYAFLSCPPVTSVRTYSISLSHFGVQTCSHSGAKTEPE